MWETPRSRDMLASIAAAAGTAALSGAAQASTINESADFGNDFPSSTLLPSGTDVVNGNVSGTGDFNDFISFQDLLAGGSWSISATHDGAPGFLFLSERDDVGALLQSDDGAGNLALSGTIPASGMLHFNIAAEGSGVNYTLTLTAVPEPATAALLGGGLLAVAALRRARGRDRS